MSTTNTIQTLEAIAQEAILTDSEILLDATTPSSTLDFSFVNELSLKGRLYKIDQDALKYESEYLDFLIEFAKRPYVTTTQRVLNETARIPRIVKKRLNELSSIQIAEKEKRKLNLENEELIRANLEKIEEYVKQLRPKVYSTGDEPASTFFKMAATMKATLSLPKRRERKKYIDHKGEDSLAAIAFQRSLDKNKKTIALSNDKHLKNIIANFYRITQILDAHYNQDAAKLLVENPIQLYGLSPQSPDQHKLFLNTANPQEIKTLDKIAEKVGGHAIRNAILTLIPHFEYKFGNYNRRGMHKLLQNYSQLFKTPIKQSKAKISTHASQLK